MKTRKGYNGKLCCVIAGILAAVLAALTFPYVLYS